MTSLREEVKALIKVLWYFMIFLLYIHFSACIFFYIIDIEKTYIPPIDYLDYTATTMFTSEAFHQYLIMMYYNIALVGGNELGPTSYIECMYIVYLNIAAAIINSYIFGEMSFLVTVISRK